MNNTADPFGLAPPLMSRLVGRKKNTPQATISKIRPIQSS